MKTALVFCVLKKWPQKLFGFFQLRKKLIVLFLKIILLLVFVIRNSDCLAAFNFEYQGIGFYAFSYEETGSAPIYRFSNPSLGAYFYTASIIEKNDILKNGYGFTYQGVAFYGYDYPKSGTAPVYRFANREKGIYFYTTSKIEKDYLIKNDPGFEYQGIAFYAYDYEKEKTSPVHRFANRLSGFYFFTSSIFEKNQLIANDYGPEISVGLWYYTRDGLQESPFKFKANKNYNIRDKNGNLIAQNISASTITRVTYDGDKKLKIYNSVPDVLTDKEIYFEAADGDNLSLIVDIYRPNSSYDQYRGKAKLRYSDETKKIWVINVLPLEHYVQGDCELAGTGDMDHNRVMVTSFRTYGYWKILYSTKYASEGFKVDATPGNQLYCGYDYEKDHDRVSRAAQETAGKIVTYKGEIAITPYSSWTDGRTRSWEERWGSDDYPWCQSVKDPYGKHPTMSTAELEAAGNHMVGLSANGSVNLAGNYGWSWEKIIRYYYTGVDIKKMY